MKFLSLFTDGSILETNAASLQLAIERFHELADERDLPTEAELSVVEFKDNEFRRVLYLSSGREETFPLKSQFHLKTMQKSLAVEIEGEFDDDY